MDPGPPDHPSLLDNLLPLGALAAPALMVAVGAVLLNASSAPPGAGWSHPDRPLALAWFAMVVAWPLTEYFLLSLLYTSHDDPPGSGILRSAMAAAAAALVVWHAVNLRAS